MLPAVVAEVDATWPVTWVVFEQDGQVGQVPGDAERRLLERCQKLLSAYFPPPRSVRAESYRARPVDQPGALYLRLDFGIEGEHTSKPETGRAGAWSEEFWPCGGAGNETEVFGGRLGVGRYEGA
ncbi:hypothetical protein [Deinococcus ruber]|uniref:Uncharacterized protein n=1 Tax=Deinococcus ruber TaxID=1848197 RepID=A0A918F8M5_9DEIO|nr:hypothetical protein [Deinococcus ruber]GGR15939.1 hypothetical protein GCM10008957_30850 [Deinococcus ruber]